MAKPKLFEPLRVRNVELANRIVIAPMCQYSCEDGRMNDWHAIHLGQLALSGAALLTIEATAVLPEGRITHADLGLWDDATEDAMRAPLASIRRWSEMPIAIQLAHAGRKASCEVPWAGGAQLPPHHANGWQTVAPSPIAHNAGDHPPHMLDRDGLRQVRDAFAEAARRAARLGLDAVQVHGAHGYLLHQFLSPLSNRRDDEYGGSLENRMRFPLEVFDAVREAFPHDRAVTMRVSGTDWVDGGWEIAQTIEFAKALEKRGCDAIHVSSGGVSAQQKIAVARRLRPRAFVFENVRGLLNAKWNEKGDRIWPDVLRTFKEIDGYTVAYELVKAKEYGVPQNRPRVLLVGLRDDGIREDVKAKFLREAPEDKARDRGFLPKPQKDPPPNLEDLLGDLMDPKYKAGMKQTSAYPGAVDDESDIQKYLRKGALKQGDEVTDHVYSNHSEKVLKKFKALRKLKKGEKLGVEHATKKFAQRVLPGVWEEGVGPTITATSLPDDYVHYSQDRTLTVREWARLQMFPDWYRFEGSRTTGGIRRAGNPREGIFDREVPKYTQIGNAVPVGLAKAVGLHLKKLLAR